MRRVFGAALLTMLGAGMLVPCRADRTFDPLFQVAGVKGKCFIQSPDGGEFVPLQEGRAYPCGSVLRTMQKSSVTAYLSGLDTVKFMKNSEAQITWPEPGSAYRVIRLRKGTLSTFLSTETVPDGEELSNMLSVETSVATCDKIEGVIGVSVQASEDETALLVKTKNGKMRVQAPQITIAELKKLCSLSIKTAIDESFTRIENLRGDYVYQLDRGSMEPVEARARQGAVAKIWRKRTTITDRLIVSVLVSRPDGTLDQRYSFREGDRAEGSFDVAGEVADPLENEPEADPGADPEEQPDTAADPFAEPLGDDPFGGDPLLNF